MKGLGETYNGEIHVSLTSVGTGKSTLSMHGLQRSAERDGNEDVGSSCLCW